MAAISSSVASRPSAATGSADNFRRERPDCMHSKNLAVLFLRYHFDEPFMLAKDGRLAIADERKLSGLHLEARFARLLLRKAYGTDLRLAVSSVRAPLAIERLARLCRPCGPLQ